MHEAVPSQNISFFVAAALCSVGALLWLMVNVERGLAQLSVQGQAYQPSGVQND